jgi:division protein CdvB (Snf7/Vps24/ESCRT-III family)
MSSLVGRLIRLARSPQGRKFLTQAQAAARSPQARKLATQARKVAQDPKNRERLRQLRARTRKR